MRLVNPPFLYNHRMTLSRRAAFLPVRRLSGPGCVDCEASEQPGRVRRSWSMLPSKTKGIGDPIGSGKPKRPAAFDPDARNADPREDNTVQDGTIWERPADLGLTERLESVVRAAPTPSGESERRARRLAERAETPAARRAQMLAQGRAWLRKQSSPVRRDTPFGTDGLGLLTDDRLERFRQEAWESSTYGLENIIIAATPEGEEHFSVDVDIEKALATLKEVDPAEFNRLLAEHQDWAEATAEQDARLDAYRTLQYSIEDAVQSKLPEGLTFSVVSHQREWMRRTDGGGLTYVDEFSFAIEDTVGDGGKIGDGMVKMSPKDQGNWIYGDILTLNDDVQSQQISTYLFAGLIEHADAQGIENLTMEANINVGGYAWGRYGFYPESPTGEIDDFEFSRLFPEEPRTRMIDSGPQSGTILDPMRDRIVEISDEWRNAGRKFTLAEVRRAALDEYRAFREEVLDRATDDQDVTAWYDFVDSRWGKASLLGMAWKARLDLSDPVQRRRLMEYIGRDRGSPGETKVLKQRRSLVNKRRHTPSHYMVPDEARKNMKPSPRVKGGHDGAIWAALLDDPSLNAKFVEVPAEKPKKTKDD